MEIRDYFDTYVSDTTVGAASQVLSGLDEIEERTGRMYFKLSRGGGEYSLLFTNEIDATFGEGEYNHPGDIGEDWDIISLRIGLTQNEGDEPTEWKNVTFCGNPAKHVTGKTTFCTDAVYLGAERGDYLCYEITVRGKNFPYHEELVLKVDITKNSLPANDKKIPVPVMIGSDRKVTERIGFLGDSITQGCGTEPGSYTHWVAKIEEGLPDEYSVWNLGIGYARTYDAAENKGWLERAKMCDTVNICLGTNDLLRVSTYDEVERDLETVIRLLREAGCRLILFTVPPFDIREGREEHWYKTNDYIRNVLSSKVDKVFDFAEILGQPAPNKHKAVYETHPNAVGCALVAEKYLADKVFAL